MIQIEETVLANEIYNIIGNKSAGVYNVKHSLILHTKELDVPIDTVESIEIMRDYNNNISDIIIATFFMDMGDYVKDIHPFRDNLMLTISRNINGYKVRDMYKFIIVNNQNGINGSRYTRSSRDELNKYEQARVIGQCVDRTVEVLRLQSVSGIYRNTTIKDLIHSSMLSSISKTSIDSTTTDIAFNLIEPHNNRVYQHLTIPTGTNVMDLPSYLQDTEYGVYNGGVGTYLQNYSCKECPDMSVFVYPLYNREIFDQVDKKLIVYAINSTKFDMVEHTYLVDGDLVKIIAGGSTVTKDDAENDMMNQGNGYTYVDANTVLERNVIVTDDGIVADTDKTNISGIIKERKDGADKTVHLGATDNVYRHRSDIIKSEMMLVQITWSYANPELLYPGMPVLYNYVDNEYGLVKLKGSLQSLFVLYNEGTKTVNSVMNLMVEKPYSNTIRTISKSDELNKRG